jgi:hypothetical protein
MATITMVGVPASWRAMIAEEHHACVVALRSMSQKVEGGIVIQQEVVRSAALRSNDIWSLDRVTAEKDGEVESNNVIVSFTGVEFDSKASWIAGKIWKFSSQGDGRISEENGCLDSGTSQEVRLRPVSHLMRM